MLNKTPTPYLTNLIKKLAPKVGAKVIVEPEWGIAAQIVYKNGVVRSLRYLSLDLNHIASSDIAKDKDYAKFFLNKNGYPVAEGQTVFSDSWAQVLKSNRKIPHGLRYAKKLGFPVIVKPNSSSQGSGVSVAYNQRELKSALIKIFKSDRIALVERYSPGHDYRVVVLDNEVISAYERIPLSVVGDGKTSVIQLLKRKNNLFIKQGWDTRINFKDSRIKDKLRRRGHTFKSVLKKGERVFMLHNANLSTGGDSIDATKTTHAGFKKISIDITKKMGLRICGVDIMIAKGDITKNPKKCKYFIIEINAAPGLDHYVTTGPAQRKIVEAMYLKILKALGKKD